MYVFFSCSDLNHCRLDNFGPSVQTLTGLLMDFVSDHQRELPEHGQELCMDLVDVSEKLRIHANRRLGNRKVVLNDVSGLGQIFSELVDALLLKKIQVSRLLLWLSIFLSRVVWTKKHITWMRTVRFDFFLWKQFVRLLPNHQKRFTSTIDTKNNNRLSLDGRSLGFFLKSVLAQESISV